MHASDYSMHHHYLISWIWISYKGEKCVGGKQKGEVVKEPVHQLYIQLQVCVWATYLHDVSPAKKAVVRGPDLPVHLLRYYYLLL